MDDRGVIAVWMDPDKDREALVDLLRVQFPNLVPQFLNPRYFDGPHSVGVDSRLIRAHALATRDHNIHDAYEVEGVAYIDMRDAPGVADAHPPRVVIYTLPHDNDWTQKAKTYARVNYPSISVRTRDVDAFRRPEKTNVKAVIVPATREGVAQACEAANQSVIRLPLQGMEPVEPGELEKDSSEFDDATLDATLELDKPNLAAVVGVHSRPGFIRALLEREQANQKREGHIEVLQNQLRALGAEVVAQKPAFDKDVAVVAELLDRPAREIEGDLKEWDKEEVALLTQLEMQGKNRASVLRLLEGREKELAEVAPE